MAIVVWKTGGFTSNEFTSVGLGQTTRSGRRLLLHLEWTHTWTGFIATPRTRRWSEDRPLGQRNGLIPLDPLRDVNLARRRRGVRL